MGIFNIFKKESPEKRRIHAEIEMFIEKCNSVIKNISKINKLDNLLKMDKSLNNLYNLLNDMIAHLEEAHSYFKVDNKSNREATLNELRQAKLNAEYLEKILKEIKIKNSLVKSEVLTHNDINNIKYLRDNLIITISRILTLKDEN